MDEICSAVEMLLSITRSEISEGNPHQALAALIQAITLTRGEEGIMEVLREAKERADEEYERQSMVNTLKQAREISRRLINEETLLSERGEQIILKDAFEDGSSVVCSKCGSLIPRVRAQNHSLYWCEFSGNEMNESDDDNVVVNDC